MIIESSQIAYKKLTIYFFSGTGNSKVVSKWLSEVAMENQIATKVINIAQLDRHSIEAPEPDSLIAFVSPVHGFNYPPIVLHFILHFPQGNNKVLLLNTRAGMLIGKFITPGLSGIAFYLAALILIIKGYSIKSMFPVDLPSNWLSIHPGLNKKTVQYMHERNKTLVVNFAENAIIGKSYFKGMYEIIQDVLVSPISLGYYFIGRFVFAKTFYASSDCNKCDLCEKSCPVNAIIKIDNRHFWTFNCESCMKCMSNCPKKAIETAHGFIISVGLFYNSILLLLFYKYFNLYFFEIENNIFKFTIESILFLGLLAISYKTIHYLMKYKFIERIMVYTSLTKFKFWGNRYKSLFNEPH